MARTQLSSQLYKDRSITTAKIALAAINGELIAEGEVNNSHLAPMSVNTDNIVDLSIVDYKLAAKSVTAAKVADGAITGGAQFASIIDVNGKTFDGNVSFSAYVNVIEGTENNHAVNKNQLDTAISTLAGSISALGNALNYVGTVAGGADAASAFQLNDLTEKDTGDMYKVATTGYFKVGTNAAFEAKVNDHLLWNTTGGVDHFDHNDATVTGTSNFINVIGTAETGYQIDFDLAFKNRMTAAETKIGVASLTTTATALAEAVNEHDVEIGDISTLVTTNKTSVVAALNEIANTGAASKYKRETPSGVVNGSNTVFTLSTAPAAITVQVFLDGVLQDLTEDYSLSGSTITFVGAPVTDQKVRAIYFQQ
ncbi:hypothetical protein HUU62_08600 [Rhodoferax sp. 4810]|uniref:Uncharacterized protein n=1 Tax=Thiospirillum jenense TaxID=1653858 RepID=A0A839HBH5_9GAMM|nr:hypothetical protein [Thiospirillum jenense]MBB1074468.1 hypothetical protein [Rhodoferax jenense]MBB1125550.1 hypothetical protein [Thiospirillum jenense]